MSDKSQTHRQFKDNCVLAIVIVNLVGALATFGGLAVLAASSQANAVAENAGSLAFIAVPVMIANLVLWATANVDKEGVDR